MKVVYIISTEKKRADNIYKPGKHTGSIRKLESRYVTALINPIVYFYYPTKYASLIEKEIKKKLDNRRIINNNGTKTEWVYAELKLITDIIYETDAILHQLAITDPNNKKLIDILSEKSNDESDEESDNESDEQSNEEPDTMQLFIDKYYDDHEGGIITKNNFIKLYQKYYNIRDVKISNLTSDLERLGYSYNSQGKKTENKLIYDKNNIIETKILHRGTIIGLKENKKLVKKIKNKENEMKKIFDKQNNRNNNFV